MPHQKIYQISIPKPCREGWENMSASEKGKFCNSCQKEVIDFTKLSDAEIVKLIQKSSGGMCGHFRPSQLNRAIVSEKYNSYFTFKTKALGSLLALASLQPIITTAANINAIEFSIPYHDYSPENLDVNSAQESRNDTAKHVIKGVVLDIAKYPVANAVLSIAGDTVGTTKSDGKFEIEVSAGDVLTVSAIDFEYHYVTVTEELISSQTPLIIIIHPRISVDGMIYIDDLKPQDIPKPLGYGNEFDPYQRLLWFILESNR